MRAHEVVAISALKILLVYYKNDRQQMNLQLKYWCEKCQGFSCKNHTAVLYKSCKDTGNERILIIHWSCFETHFDWRTFFVTRCCWYFPIFRHLIILWLGNNIKIANFSTNVLSVFAISTCLQSFRILRSDFHK